MKSRWLWVILAALGVAGIFGLTVYAAGGKHPSAYISPWNLFLYSTPITRLADMLLGLIFLLVVPIGLIEVGTSKNPRGSQFLTAMLIISVLLGALGFAERAYIICVAVQASHTTNMRVVAPSAAEALMPLTMAFIIAAVASILSAMIKAKGRKAAAA